MLEEVEDGGVICADISKGISTTLNLLLFFVVSGTTVYLEPHTLYRALLKTTEAMASITFAALVSILSP